eukprot:NODE_729_length_4379_cov_1.289486.p1 type:complete len:646 gc:universal NODE_729_length_4379_cov_1.289486:1967-3904(+)
MQMDPEELNNLEVRAALKLGKTIESPETLQDDKSDKLQTDQLKAKITVLEQDIGNLDGSVEKLNLDSNNGSVLEATKTVNSQISTGEKKSAGSRLIDYISDIQIDTNSPLGSGAYGAVYLGESNGEKRAIKIFKDVLFIDPQCTQITSDTVYFSREIIKELRAFEKLANCPEICKYFGVTSIDGHLGVIMEYLDNCSLHTWLHLMPKADLNPKSLTNPQINKIQLGIAQGLEYMHDNEIAHNDLKPANIMLDNQFNPKLIDFGMVKIINSSYKSVHSSKELKLGTANWRAPEYWQYNEQSHQYQNQFPFAGDVFSFGVILGEMATRQIPWHHCNHIGPQLLQGIRPYSENQMDPNLFQIIENAWQQHPKQRNSISMILNQLQLYQFDSHTITDLYNINGIQLFRLLKKSIQHVQSELFEKCLLKLIKYTTSNTIKTYLNLSDLRPQMTLLAAQISNPFTIALMKYYQIGFQSTNKDIFESFTTCQDNLSLVFIGLCHKNGRGTVKNPLKAFEMYQKASDLNIPAGHYHMGWCYKKGTGCDQKDEMALKYFKMAALSHFSSAYLKIGYFYGNGIYVDLDYEKAFYYYELSATYGNSQAYNNLGTYYRYGKGCEKNIGKSIENYKVAIELGYEKAQIRLDELCATIK